MRVRVYTRTRTYTSVCSVLLCAGRYHRTPPCTHKTSQTDVYIRAHIHTYTHTRPRMCVYAYQTQAHTHFCVCVRVRLYTYALTHTPRVQRCMQGGTVYPSPTHNTKQINKQINRRMRTRPYIHTYGTCRQVTLGASRRSESDTMVWGDPTWGRLWTTPRWPRQLLKDERHDGLGRPHSGPAVDNSTLASPAPER